MDRDKILVIDDEQIIFDSIKDTLEGAYQLYYAENGEVGLKLFEEHHPILIILDIRMSVMDGFEFLQQIGISPDDAYAVIVLSGHAIGAEISACYKMGVTAFLRKPFNIFELKGLVEQSISAKKQYQALLQEKDFARSIIDYSMSTIIAVDEKRRIKEFNKAAERMYGYTAAEVIGQPIVMIYGNDAVSNQVSEEMQTNGCFIGEVVSKRKNGESFLVRIAATVLRDRKGNTIGSVGSSQDLTKERQAEADRHARDVAQVANKAKSEFLANMSHEIRTPMNAIIGLTDLALKQELTPKLDGYLTKVHNASRSLLRLLNDILDFSKIEAGKMELNPEPFYLHDIFERLAELFRQQAFNKTIELSLAITAQQEFALIGDALKLEQVLINLVGNAVKFTHAGEIVVRLTLREQTADNVHLEFSVRDTGIGISPDRIEQLFAPFVQADSSHTRKYGGTGLGLAISKQIVEMMGGKIWVESTLGQGSIFYFTMTFGRQASTVQRIPVPPADLHGMKLLVVDDNEAAREIFKDILRAFSFDPVMACSGEEALQKIATAEQAGTPYPLILLDWKMPGLDGIETSRRVKDIGSKAKIIMLTAFGMDEGKEEAEKAGVDAFFTKPINRSRLFDAIMDVCGQEVPKQYHARRAEIDDTIIMEKIGGARILLVEDNHINQQVAREILEGVGVVVDIANNGLEAVHLVWQRQYDAVLMDLQMPQMDGYEATERIRSDGRFKELPIIAVTAHAMTSDREKCLAAGMNEHIIKPIEPQQLYAALIQCMKLVDRTESRAILAPLALPSAADEVVLLDVLPGVNMHAGLQRLRGNRKLYRSLLLEFGRDFAQTADKIRTALVGRQKGDAEFAKNLVHTVKGLAGNISAEELYQAAVALEKGIKAEQQQDWPTLLDRFENTLNLVLDSIQTLKQQEEQGREPVATVVVDRVKTRLLLNKLAVLIQGGDSEAEECFASVKPYLQDVSIAREVGQLADSLEQFDFPTAREALTVIVKVFDVNLDAGA